MKLLSKARENSIRQQILSQADTIRYLKGQITKLETENRMQAERIAGLEAVLYAAGVLDKDAVLATDGDKAWFADQVLARCEGDDTSSAADAAPAELGTSHASRASGSPQGEGNGNGIAFAWELNPGSVYCAAGGGGAV